MPTATPIFPQTVKQGAVQILPADTTSLKTIYTAPANGSRVDNILITSTDTSSKDIQLVVTISSTDYVLGTIAVPANSGFTNSVVSLNMLAHSNLTSALNSDNNGNKYLFLASGSILKIKALTTVTAAKAINVVAQIGDF